MARFDRCVVCDYVEGEGSDYANLPPDGRRVIHRGDLSFQPYCDLCYYDIFQNYLDITEDDGNS